MFEEAYSQFLQCLPERERHLYSPRATPQDVLDGLKKLEIVTKCQQRHGLTVIKRIEQFHDRLRPYFETVGIFIQSNPQYSALVWGALRLVLEV